jgi:hypothetical protein
MFAETTERLQQTKRLEADIRGDALDTDNGKLRRKTVNLCFSFWLEDHVSWPYKTSEIFTVFDRRLENKRDEIEI